MRPGHDPDGHVLRRTVTEHRDSEPPSADKDAYCIFCKSEAEDTSHNIQFLALRVFSTTKGKQVSSELHTIQKSQNITDIYQDMYLPGT